MLTLSVILYINVMEMFDFIKIYPVYAVPFQIIIPVTIWIAAERKVRKDRVLS
jgi:spore germination protein KB